MRLPWSWHFRRSERSGMKSTGTSPARRQLAIIAIAVALWFSLWLLLWQVNLPIPPYFRRTDVSVAVQLVSNLWAAALVILPGLLPVLAILFARRNSIAPFRHPFAAGVVLLSFVPLLIVVGAACKRMSDEPYVDSVISPLFYFYYLSPR